ncbi:hypothetical protein SAY86_004079 [Trapa natans]|uniref:Protein kinase domain-containing protein n=1 Tax=Trapa natans TaxID=22666 RepID=A0AAN7MUM5_TRANT|nr:hypothetical protein SAY86_004079 [Trapa natans]
MEVIRRRVRASFFSLDSLAIFFFLLLFFLVERAASQQQHLLSNVELSSLYQLRSSLGLQARFWPIKGNPCTNWTGVTCNNSRVTGINIFGFRRTRLGRLNPQFSVDALANLTHLSSFNASGFLLPGPIPDWLGFTVGLLRILDLRFCSITGAIPGSLGSLTKLKSLYLSDNNLTGNIDSNLGKLSELSVLSLSGNLLTGSIPEELSMLGNLTVLDLSSNFITGIIPPILGSISGLQVLNLSDNGLTASVPAQLSNLSHLTALDLSQNSVSGPLPAELSGLMNLQDVRIRNNSLQGPFPESIFSGLVRLKYLDVSGNNFTGELPRISSWGSANLSNVSFYFSNNMFYGTLNLSSSLDFLDSLDLSGNYFQGNVTGSVASYVNVKLDNNCLQNIMMKRRSLSDCQQFYSQRNLSFYGFEDSETFVPFEATSRRWVYILVGIGSGMGLLLLLLLIIIFVIVRLRREGGGGDSGQRGRNADASPVPEGQRQAVIIPKLMEPFTLSAILPFGFSYDQLVQATCGFDKANLIKNGHSGDLYVGVGLLAGSQSPVVIKRVLTSTDPEGPYLSNREESYAVELEFFSRTSSTRLVPLLGHCLEKENEKFLVYKYMPNRDLESSFYKVTKSAGEGKTTIRSLDWITRSKIAIGAAEGLAYLHHECSPPLVHRDVQASSILLDDKFEVRLGSLSEAHVQEGDPHHNTVIARLLRRSQ